MNRRHKSPCDFEQNILREVKSNSPRHKELILPLFLLIQRLDKLLQTNVVAPVCTLAENQELHKNYKKSFVKNSAS